MDEEVEQPFQLLNVIALEPEVEKALSDALIETAQGIELNLPSQLTGQLFEQLSQAVEHCFFEGYKKTAILCDPRLRFHLRRLIEKKFPRVPVISYAEVAPGFKVNILKSLSFSQNSGDPFYEKGLQM